MTSLRPALRTIFTSAAGLALMVTAGVTAQDRGASMLSVSVAGKDGAEPAAGQPVTFDIRARDPSSGYPLTGLSPSVWLVPDDGDETGCQGWVNRLAGSPVPPPGVADLNGYDIIQLARDGTLAVIDPRLNLATANIRSLTRLESLPALWSIDPGGATFAVVPGNARSKIRLFDLAPIAVREEIDAGAAIVSLDAGEDSLLAGTADGRLLRFSADGTPAGEMTLGTGSVLLQRGEDGGLIALAQDGRGLFEGDSGRAVRFAGVPGGSRSVSYSSLADGAYILAADGRSLSILHRDEPGRLVTLPLEAEAARLVPEKRGQWLALPSPDGRSVAIFDTRIGAVRWTIAAKDPVRDVLFSDSFLYFTHARAGGVTRVVFDPDGNAPGIAMIAAGEAAASDRAPSLMPLVVRVPGNGIIAASPDRRVGFMVAEDGAQAAMSSLPLLAGDSAGLLLRYRGAREVGRNGAYRAGFVPDHGGRYLAVVRIDQPELAHCQQVRIAGEPDPALAPSSKTAKAGRAIGLRLLGTPSTGDTDVRFVIDGAVSGTMVREVVLMSDRGSWHRFVQVTPEGGGRYRFRTTIPRQGRYRLFAEVVGGPDKCQTLGLDVPVL